MGTTFAERLEILQDNLPLPRCVSRRARWQYGVGLVAAALVLLAAESLYMWMLVGFQRANIEAIELWSWPQPFSAVSWQNRCWYLTSSGGVSLDYLLRPDDCCESNIRAHGPPLPIRHVPLASPSNDPLTLLPDGARLWLLSRRVVAFIEAGELHIYHDTRPLKPAHYFAQPFIYRGRPTLIERDASEWWLTTLVGRDWHRSRKIEGGADYAAADGDSLWLLRHRGHDLYARRDDGSAGSWQLVMRDAGYVSALTIDGRFSLFVRTKSSLLGLRRSDSGWRTWFASDALYGVPAAAPRGRGEFYVFDQNFSSDAVRLLTIDGSGIVRDSAFHPGPMQIPPMWRLGAVLALMLFPIPFFLQCLAIDYFIRKYRLPHFLGQEIPPASLSRRGAAASIDLVVIAWPWLAWWLHAVWNLQLPGEPAAAQFAWVAASLLIIAWMEGRSGVTPGKWLLGLRTMGTDLRPCGFRRALMRTVPKALPMLLPLFGGLTDNRQHAGDLWADTLVLRKSR